MKPDLSWHLLVGRGWGSALPEAMLTLAGLPYTREEMDPSEPGAERDRLLALNPLGQIPTAILPDGSVMTESAAMALRISELVPEAGLAPAADHPDRAAFLRWLVFLVAAVYPTFTYGDDPSRWVSTAPPELRASTDAQRKACWTQMEGAAKGPWFLGETFSAIDVYIGVMSRWRPGRAWFQEACPRLTTIAKAVDALPALALVWAANFS